MGRGLMQAYNGDYTKLIGVITVTTRFGNLSRFETGTSHFATSMVLSWDAHLETHTHSPHRCLLGLHSSMMHCYYISISTHKHPLFFIFIYIYFIRRTHTNL